MGSFTHELIHPGYSKSYAVSNLSLFFIFSEKSKRRTKTIASTCDPSWNQTFMYYPIKESDFRDHILEVTLWDYNKHGASQFMGEVGSTLKPV